jgi:molybdopterin synthase sulfur carrier subunit
VLTIKFFSLIREAVGVSELTMTFDPQVATIDALKTALGAAHGEVWVEALSHPNLVHALNQRVVDPDAPLSDGDEVAFFPPMTGG